MYYCIAWSTVWTCETGKYITFRQEAISLCHPDPETQELAELLGRFAKWQQAQAEANSPGLEHATVWTRLESEVQRASGQPRMPTAIELVQVAQGLKRPTYISPEARALLLPILREKLGGTTPR